LVVRKLAGIALAAGVLFSVAGCSFNPHPESLQSYAPSDGVGVDLTFDKAHRNEGVAFRNFLILTDGSSYTLYGTIINSGNKDEKLAVELASDNSQAATVTVAAGSTLVLNKDNQPQLALSGQPGALLDLKVGTAAGTNWETLSVPVLDGTLSYYHDLVSPTPAATN
jgi:hypothetical protein